MLAAEFSNYQRGDKCIDNIRPVTQWQWTIRKFSVCFIQNSRKHETQEYAGLFCLSVSFKSLDEKENKLTGDVGLVELVEYKQLELGGLGILDTPCHCCHPSSNFFVSSSFLSSQLKCLWFLLLKASLFFYWPNWSGIDQKGRWTNSDFPTFAPFSMSSLLLESFSVTFCFRNHLLNIFLFSHFDHFCPASADILTSFLCSEQNFSDVSVLSDILDLSLSADWIVVVLPDDPLHFLSDHKSRLNFKGH